MKVKGKERERKKEACLIVNKTISTSTTTTKKKINLYGGRVQVEKNTTKCKQMKFFFSFVLISGFPVCVIYNAEEYFESSHYNQEPLHQYNSTI